MYGEKARVRIRADRFLWSDAHGQLAIREFVAKYLYDPAFHTKVKLLPSDVVMIDNRRMLHSRTKVVESPTDGRLMRRIWIADEPEYLYATTADLAFQPYLLDPAIDQYTTIASPVPYKYQINWPRYLGEKR